MITECFYNTRDRNWVTIVSEKKSKDYYLTIIAHILGILLMNSCNTDIFFSNYYHLQSVRFELIIQLEIIRDRKCHDISYKALILNKSLNQAYHMTRTAPRALPLPNY